MIADFHYSHETLKQYNKSKCTLHSDIDVESLCSMSMWTLAAVVPTIHWHHIAQVEKYSLIVFNQSLSGVTSILKLLSMLIQQRTLFSSPHLCADLTHYKRDGMQCSILEWRMILSQQWFSQQSLQLEMFEWLWG